MMANLEEQSIWDDGVYQLEDTDAMKGGPPNIATLAGVDNVPHLQLARRTRWLRDALDTIAVDGTAAVRGLLRLATSTEAREGVNATKALTPATAAAAFLRRDLTGSALGSGSDLDTVTTPGVYRWGINAPVNAPAGLTQNAVMLVETTGTMPVQMVFGSTTGRLAIRTFDGAAWSAWSRFWGSAEAYVVQTGSFWSRFAPDGILEQWGTASSPSGSPTTVTLPFAYADAQYNIQLTDQSNNTGLPGNIRIFGVAQERTTPGSFVFAMNPAANDGVMWRTIGVGA